jgi:hypothetical protein
MSARSSDPRRSRRAASRSTLPRLTATPVFVRSIWMPAMARSATWALGIGRHARLIAQLIHPEAYHLAARALAEGEGKCGPQARR